MNNEDVRGEDVCDQADGDKEYRNKTRTAAKRKTRRTAARAAAARMTALRSTVASMATARATGRWQGQLLQGGSQRGVPGWGGQW